MAININDQFDEWKNDESFDFTEMQENSEEPEKNEDTEEPDNAVTSNKTSFAELRHKRKIPRLKKSMVLGIIAGGTFIFLLVVNLFIQKKEEQKKYFDEQRNTVAVGHDFSLGDMAKRPRQKENEITEITEHEEPLWKTPPSYAPVSEYKLASMPPGGVTVTPIPNDSGNFSDSDLLAMKAQIGKEGGYGLAIKAVNHNSIPEAWGHIPSREEYTKQRLDDIARFAQTAGGGGQASANRLNTGRFTEAGSYNPDNTQAGLNISYLDDNCLFPGAIIHAILVSRIDTDYPGPIHARVTENVYDSMTGKNLLIPQGTILQGNYSSSSIGVAKVQIAWESMVVNYGGIAYQVSLGGMAGVDKRGRAGIAGTLDEHYFEWLKAAGVVSLFTILHSEMAYQTRGQNNTQIRELMDVNQGIVNQLGAKIIDRALNIQPTVRVANGTAVSVSVNAPVNVRPFPAIKAEEKYVRKK
ncbi:MAG: TrbI/VirB10 family protein [Treponema sp.]|nr:TrbI/VirB10 family protein [Treponema sp.]